MIRKDRAHPTGRDISIRRTAASLMRGGCQGLSLRCCRDKNHEIRTSVLFCLLERFLFVLLFVGKARLVGLSLFLLFYFLVLEM